jgi:hypothetical protein
MMLIVPLSHLPDALAELSHVSGIGHEDQRRSAISVLG